MWGALVLIIVAVAAGSWWLIALRSSSPFSAGIKSSVSFALYYPTTEPKGYRLDPSSIINSRGTVFYNVTASSGKPPIKVSQQQIPKNFDPKVLFGHNPLPSTISPIGTVYDLSSKDQSRYMVTASDSLIFISSTGKISGSDLQLLIKGMKIAK